MRTIEAKIVRADGVRVRLTIANTYMLAMLYHVAEVYPGHQSCQLKVVSRAGASA